MILSMIRTLYVHVDADVGCKHSPASDRFMVIQMHCRRSVYYAIFSK